MICSRRNAASAVVIVIRRSFSTMTIFLVLFFGRHSFPVSVCPITDPTLPRAAFSSLPRIYQQTLAFVHAPFVRSLHAIRLFSFRQWQLRLKWLLPFSPSTRTHLHYRLIADSSADDEQRCDSGSKVGSSLISIMRKVRNRRWRKFYLESNNLEAGTITQTKQSVSLGNHEDLRLLVLIIQFSAGVGWTRAGVA